MTLHEIIDGADLEDIKEALAEVKRLRVELDALKVKREAVLAAMSEVDDLQEKVSNSASKIKEHLRQAL